MKRVCLLAVVAGAGLLPVPAPGESRVDGRRFAAQAGVAAGFDQLPLRFERNEGQTDPEVAFLARGRGYALFLTPSEVVLSLEATGKTRSGGAGQLDGGHGGAGVPRRSVVRMKLLGGRARPEIHGEEELAGKSHYYIGSDPRKWRTNVAQYGRVVCRGVWEGIDVAYYGTEGGQLETDFTVAPGADPGAIRVAFEGAGTIRLDAEGNLVLSAGGGDVVQRRPLVYQDAGGVRKRVAGSWVVKGKDRAGFRVAAYDRSAALVIDPILVYSSYLGGSGGDAGHSLAVDAAGNAYITGETGSTNFPTAGPPFQPANAGGRDAFVVKLSPTSGLVYATYLGGGVPAGGYGNYVDDIGYGIAVDPTGGAYVAGSTTSQDFPATGSASPPTTRGGLSDPRPSLLVPGWLHDRAFVARLSPTGALLYSRVGGASGAHAVAVDAGGNVYVTGYQRCALATAVGCLQYQTFVRKMSPTLQQDGDAYSTFLGDADCCQTSGQSIAVDMAGHTYVTGVTDDAGLPAAGTPFQPALGGGDDAFLVEVSPTGGLLYSTYLGGSANDSGAGVAVDAVGNAYLTGETASADFPTAGSPFQPANAGGRDGFVAKLSSTAGLLYSTYLGGSADDSGRGIAVDAAGNAHLTGQTASGGFPTAGSPFQPALAGQSDAFVAKLSPTSGLIESTYLGGSAVDDGRGIAIDAAANIYVTGSTSSANFYTAGSPVQAVSAGSGDAFVVGIRGDGTAFFTVTPCRVADTRSPAGSSGGPALGAHTTRSFPVAGLCGVPPTAVAVAINVTVVDATDYGDLRLFPAGATAPATSTINFGAYTVRANNAVIALGTGGQVSVRCDMPPGSTGQTDFLFDVTGYFE